MSDNPNARSITIHCDKNIKSITRDNEGQFIRQYKNGDELIISHGDALADVTGMYIEYLRSDGKFSLPLLNDPRILFNDYLSAETPILDEYYTDYYLQQIMVGISYFKTKKCRNIDPAFGLGIFAHILYYPYISKPSAIIHNRFYNFISSGLFVLQIKCKPMALNAYKGLYTVWDMGKSVHSDYFNNKPNSLTGGFLNLLTTDDVTDSPIQHIRQYPQNMSSYTIDNVILCLAGIYEITKVYKQYRNDFLPKASADRYLAGYKAMIVFFDKFCPLYIKRTEEKNGPNPEIFYTGTQMQLNDIYEKLTAVRDYTVCPWLYYSLHIIGAIRQSDIDWAFELCRGYTNLPIQWLDIECPILCRHVFYEEERERKIRKGFLCFIAIAIGAVLLTLLAMGIIKFLTWLGGFAVPLILLIIVCYPRYGVNNGEGAPGSDHDFVINLSTGHMDMVWWV